MNPVLRFLLDAGKELIAIVVERFADGKPAVQPPKVHPRHKVVARPINEKPRGRKPDEGGSH